MTVISQGTVRQRMQDSLGEEIPREHRQGSPCLGEAFRGGVQLKLVCAPPCSSRFGQMPASWILQSGVLPHTGPAKLSAPAPQPH